MTSHPRVVFRVAAGPRVGFGHLTRCRALATALRAPFAVWLRGGVAARRAVLQLGGIVLGRVDVRQCDLIVVDDPRSAIAARVLRRARRAGVATAAVRDRVHDDTAWSRSQRAGTVADLVIDGTGSVTPHDVLLDPRIAEARARRRRPDGRRGPRVLVALGGGSHVLSLARDVVAGLRLRVPSARIDVAAGFSRGVRTPLPGARWIERPNGLAGDLARADLAVVAGGVTLLEACAAGVPIVACAVVPAQRAAIRTLAMQGAVLDAGAFAASGGGGDVIGRQAAALWSDRTACRRQAVRARQLVDGRGAARVAARIRQLLARSANRREAR